MPFNVIVIYFLDLMCGELADINTIDRNQWQAQRVEPAQQAVQGCLIKIAGHGGDWKTLVLDRYRHLPGPISPAHIDHPGHFDLVSDRSIQGESVGYVFRHE